MGKTRAFYRILIATGHGLGHCGSQSVRLLLLLLPLVIITVLKCKQRSLEAAQKLLQCCIKRIKRLRQSRSESRCVMLRSAPRWLTLIFSATSCLFK